MKITVDPKACQEYANCVVEAPDVFDLNEETGKVEVLIAEPGPERYEEVRAAAASCPVRAITLHE